MNALECIPCLLRHTIDVLDFLEVDDELRREIMTGALSEVGRIIDGSTPPMSAAGIYKVLREKGGFEDPYAPFKKLSTDRALDIMPNLIENIEKSSSPLEKAFEYAVAGNSIDLATMGRENLGKIIEWLGNLQQSDFAVNDFMKLERDLKHAKTLLYIGDNAGEVVFDRIVLEMLDIPEIYFGVRGAPALNDIVQSDAIYAGIDKPVKIVSTGSGVPGVVLDQCSTEFREIFKKADVVIAKGQGNFETLDDAERSIYFLFRVKCPLIGDRVNSDVGKFVIWKCAHD